MTRPRCLFQQCGARTNSRNRKCLFPLLAHWSWAGVQQFLLQALCCFAVSLGCVPCPGIPPGQCLICGMGPAAVLLQSGLALGLGMLVRTPRQSRRCASLLYPQPLTLGRCSCGCPCGNVCACEISAGRAGTSHGWEQPSRAGRASPKFPGRRTQQIPEFDFCNALLFISLLCTHTFTGGITEAGRLEFTWFEGI